jgi:ubiquitin carboxyl-terminal hydrolase L3
MIDPSSLLSTLIEKYSPHPPARRPEVLETSEELEAAHASVAIKGDTAAPQSAEDEVDHHYICFVRSNDDGHLYELDGDCAGPIDTGVVIPLEQDVLCDAALEKVREYIRRAEGDLGFGLMALVKR